MGVPAYTCPNGTKTQPVRRFEEWEEDHRHRCCRCGEYQLLQVRARRVRGVADGIAVVRVPIFKLIFFILSLWHFFKQSFEK
jgi:hypothetical protein